jgi:nicotinate-nucleotide pyrophosphorylase (carboxylating)
LEASGGITAKNIIEYASTGVDLVSVGEITQSSRALDISLDITSSK